MVQKKMVDFCNGCGIDVTEKKTERRLLSTAKSLPVLTLWKAFLENLGSLGDLPVGYMCRNCFSAYEQYINLQKNIEGKLHKALEKTNTTSGTPKRMRLAAGSEGTSVVFQPPSSTSVASARASLARASSGSVPSCSTSPDVGVGHHLHL